MSVVSNQVSVQMSNINGALLEKVILGNDFSGLTPIEKVTHIKNVCNSLGLNPLTKPIQLLKFQGREVPYFTKDATEQLRKLNNISLEIQETKILQDIYIVTVVARTSDGRTDSATGAVSIGGMKGDALSNAFMKCETKAKRRATLSICGLGFMDESEIDSIPEAKTVNLDKVNETVTEDKNNISDEIAKADSTLTLKQKYNEAMRQFFGQPEKIKEINRITNKRKRELEEVQDFVSEMDAETGELTHATV